MFYCKNCNNCTCVLLRRNNIKMLRIITYSESTFTSKNVTCLSIFEKSDFEEDTDSIFDVERG